jgi:hypothetical protein
MMRTSVAQELTAPSGVSPELVDSDPEQLRAEIVALRHELSTLRALRQRDQATARGLGVSLQQLRRGALALRAENEELRRALHSARGTKRR